MSARWKTADVGFREPDKEVDRIMHIECSIANKRPARYSPKPCITPTSGSNFSWKLRCCLSAICMRLSECTDMIRPRNFWTDRWNFKNYSFDPSAQLDGGGYRGKKVHTNHSELHYGPQIKDNWEETIP
jgi:hypothetical protein